MKRLVDLGLHRGLSWGTFLGVLVSFIAGLAMVFGATAQAQMPAPGPSNGNFGVEGRIPSPPPKQGATIIAPANGQSFTTTPVTVRGSCPSGTLVKIYDNEIFVGSTMCNNGNYSVEISLFNGRNDLIARVYDALDQAGPDSNKVTVTYSDPQFGQAASQVLLTSQYARRAVNPGEKLTWPLVLSNGVGPYAFSIDWGDGSPEELKSLGFAGELNPTHVYRAAGVYRVIFKVADTNGSTAILQVVAVVNGQSDGSGGPGSGSGGSGSGANADKNGTVVTKTRISWQMPLILLILLPIGFWLGRHAELVTLRRRLEREYRQQAEKLDEDQDDDSPGDNDKPGAASSTT